MKYKHLPVLLLALFFVHSCQVFQNKNRDNELNYMQNIEKIATDKAVENQQHNTIQAGDQLIIMVSASDMKVVAPFNKNYMSTGLIQPFPAGGNMPTEGQTVLAGPTYIVDNNGDINFPELGMINTKNRTLDALKEELTEKLTRYIKNPMVSIKLANFRVTVLGEVSRQGEYVIANGQGTLLNALGLAGDATMYGDRENVLVIRTVDGVITKTKIDLTDANFFKSPFYNLKQGDVIYVPASKTKERMARQNPNLPLIISAIGTVITLLAILIRR